MPVIKPYIPGKLASPLVGVADKNPKGEALREYAKDINQTKDQLEQLRGARMAGLSDIGGGVLRAATGAIDNAINRQSNRNYWTRSHQQEVQNTHDNMIAQGGASNEVTQQGQAATQMMTDMINSDAFRKDPQAVEKQFNSIIQGGGTKPDGTPLLSVSDAPGKDLSTQAILERTQSYPKDSNIDTALLRQRTLDALSKQSAHLSDTLHSRVAQQATDNLHNDITLATNTMQQGISGISAPTLQGRVEQAFQLAKPVNDAIQRGIPLFGDQQTAININTMNDKLYKGVILNVINNPSSTDPTTRYKELQDLRGFVEKGEIPPSGPQLPGALVPHSDFPKFNLTEEESKTLLSAIDARSAQSVSRIKTQDDINEGVNGHKAFNLSARIDAADDPVALDTIGRDARLKTALIDKEIGNVQHDTNIPLEVQKSRIDSLRAQHQAFLTASEKADAKATHLKNEAATQLRHQQTLAQQDATGEISEKRAQTATLREQVAAATAKLTEQTSAAKQEAIDSLDLHLGRIEQLATDEDTRGANMPAVQQEALKLLKENDTARSKGLISGPHHTKLENTALELIRQASTWTAAQSKIFGLFGGAEPQKMTGQEAATAKTNAWNAIMTELNKWRADTQQQKLNQSLQVSPDQQARITRNETAYIKNHNGQLPDAARVAIRNAVLSAHLAPAAIKGGLVPPPPPTALLPGQEGDPRMSHLENRLKEAEKQNADMQKKLDALNAKLQQGAGD